MMDFFRSNIDRYDLVRSATRSCWSFEMKDNSKPILSTKKEAITNATIIFTKSKVGFPF